ncbi:Solute-binding protein family 3/N-terminal domain of MltF [Trinorchestia longiramus]|nr:Solute-binding protein family 3/N-terminal domain of MltF [Trinorchestia longiramus]
MNFRLEIGLSLLGVCLQFTGCAGFSFVPQTKNFSEESCALSEVLLEMLVGPLNELSPVFFYDESSKETLPLNHILKSSGNMNALSVRSVDSLPENKNEEFPAFNGSTIISEIKDQVAVLLIGDVDFWIEDFSNSWLFRQVVVVIENSKNVKSFTKKNIIRHARNAIFIERYPRVGFLDGVTIKTFDYFGDQLKLLQNWNKTAFSSTSYLGPDQFQDFRGVTLHIASDSDDSPLVFEAEKNESLTGLNIEIVKALSKWLNFQFTTTYASSDFQWADFDNGTFNGLLGDVQHGDKNFTINYLTITRERAYYFDASVPYYWEGFGFALRDAPPLPEWRKLFRPFLLTVWGACAAAVVLVPIVLFGLSNSITTNSRPCTLEQAYFLFFTILIRQSPKMLPGRASEKLLVLAWLMVSFLLTSFYTSNLIAVLSVPVYPPKLETLDDLANHPTRTLMLDYGEFVPEALLASTELTMRKLGEKMDLFPIEDKDMHLYEGIRILERGQHALIETYSYLKLWTAEYWNSTADFYFLKDQIYTGPLAFFFRKHTPWSHKFNQGIQSLFEAGIINKWYEDFMNIKHEVQSEKNEQALNLNHVQGPFLLLALGLGAAILVFAVEITSHRRGSVALRAPAPPI